MGKFTPKAGFDGKSVNGTVVSSNKNGAILRNGSIPIIRQTNKSTTAKNQFSSIARLWSSLSSTVQADWNAYTYEALSGYELFQYCNINRGILGESPSGNLPVNTGSRGYTLNLLSEGPGNLVVQVIRETTGFYYSLVLYAAPPVLDENTVVNDNEYRIVHIQPILRSEYLDISEEYRSIFGVFFNKSGKTVKVYGELIRQTHGLRYNRQEASIVL